MNSRSRRRGAPRALEVQRRPRERAPTGHSYHHRALGRTLRIAQVDGRAVGVLDVAQNTDDRRAGLPGPRGPRPLSFLQVPKSPGSRSMAACELAMVASMTSRSSSSLPSSEVLVDRALPSGQEGAVLDQREVDAGREHVELRRTARLRRPADVPSHRPRRREETSSPGVVVEAPVESRRSGRSEEAEGRIAAELLDVDDLRARQRCVRCGRRLRQHLHERSIAAYSCRSKWLDRDLLRARVLEEPRPQAPVLVTGHHVAQYRSPGIFPLVPASSPPSARTAGGRRSSRR